MRNTLRRNLSQWILAGSLLLVASATTGQINPPEVDPTHYWTYRLLDPVFFPAPITVGDQFFNTDRQVTVDSLNRLVNWVMKNNSAVRDTFIHYTWWNIREKLPVNRSAIVINQFGNHPVNVLNLEFMLVPAWKNQPQAGPPNASHYLCYRAVGFPPPPQGYDLRDEWRVDFQHPQEMEYLCAPCRKHHNGQFFAPPDTVTHLALYPIFPNSDVFHPFIFDQFANGPRFVQQSSPEYLIVPSLKIHGPTENRRSSWGKVKSLYR